MTDSAKAKTGFSIRKLLLIFVLILVFLVFLAFWRNLVRLKQAQEALSEKEKTLVELRKENELAKKRLEEMSTNEYIEKQLRDNLMMQKEGEVIVVLPDEATLRSLAPVIPQPEDEPGFKPNWRLWLEKFKF